MIEFIVFISLGIIAISMMWKFSDVLKLPWLLRKRRVVISKILLVLFTIGISNFYGLCTFDNTPKELLEEEPSKESSDSSIDIEDLSEEADKIVFDESPFIQFISDTMGGFIFDDMPSSCYCTTIVIPPPESLFNV